MPSGVEDEYEYSVIDVIRAKRDKRELTESQIKSFISKLSCSKSNGDGDGGHGGGGEEAELVHEAQVGKTRSNYSNHESKRVIR